MNKMKNFKFIDESRLTFNYFKVIKNLSNNYIKFNFKMHNHLSNSRHDYLFIANLKHAYYIVSLYLKNRYYFAFTIFDIN